MELSDMKIQNERDALIVNIQILHEPSHIANHKMIIAFIFCTRFNVCI